MGKSQNAKSCHCGAAFKTYYQKMKHVRLSTDATCKMRKKAGKKRKPNADAIHRDQMQVRYYIEYYSSVEKERRELENQIGLFLKTWL